MHAEAEEAVGAYDAEEEKQRSRSSASNGGFILYTGQGRRVFEFEIYRLVTQSFDDYRASLLRYRKEIAAARRQHNKHREMEVCQICLYQQHRRSHF